MPGETLSVDVLARVQGERQVTSLGNAFDKTGVKAVLGAEGLKVWNDATVKSGKATDTLIASKLSAAKADAVLAKAENFIAGEAGKATKIMADQGRALDDTGKKAQSATKWIGGLVGGGGAGGAGLAGGGMGALIAAGVALIGPLATITTGVAGLGLAAYGALKPISNAAQATGGLSKNLHTLNPEQQAVARSLIGLEGAFGKFQQALAPTLLTDFNDAIRLAGTLLHGVEPVAAATGKALGGVLLSIDKEFQSGTWKNFFAWMARTAGPDIRLLGQDFVGLLQVLPALIQGLQPLGQGLLGATADALKLVGGLEKVHLDLPLLGAATGFFVAGPLGALIGGLAGASLELSKVHTAIDATIPSWTKNAGAIKWSSQQLGIFGPQIQRYVGYLHSSDAAGKSAAATQTQFGKAVASAAQNAGLAVFHLQTVNSAIAALSIAWASAPAKAAPLTDSITRMGAAAEITFRKAGPVTDQITRLGTSSGAAAGHVRPLTDAITMTAVANEKAFRTAGPLTDAITRLAIPAKAAAGKLADIGKAIQSITAKESTALSTMTGYNDALIGQYNSAAALNVALRTSHDQIGLNTQKQRDSFGAADTYISQTLAAAKAAGTNSGKIDDVIASLHNELPKLEDAKGGTRAYWQEVKTLVGWLDTLKNLKAIHEAIFVSGNGTFTVKAGTKLGLPGGTAGGPFATGGRVPPGFPNDTYLARLTSGEAVVDPVRTKRLAPVLGAAGVPGFAAGGLVPSYGGSVAGLVPWSRGNLNATVRIDEQAVARATLAGIRAATRAAQASPGFGVTPSGPLQAYARKLLAAYGWSAMWPAFNDIVMRESGWNVHAQNPSSGAYGIPQALPASKMASAGADWATNGFTQLRWMMGYIKSRWNDPWSADLNERTQHWYDKGGWLRPGWNPPMYNGTGRPEHLVPAGTGNTYNITVNVPPTANPRETARQIVGILNQGATGGVKLRTSILGPG